MKNRAIALGLVLFVAITSQATAEEFKIKGAELLREDTSIETIVVEVMVQPFDQAEVDYFMAHIESVIGWARENLTEWKAVDDTGPDELLSRVKALGCWEKAGIRWNEFFAFMLKTKMAQDLAGENNLTTQVAQFESQKKMLEGMLKSGQIPAENQKELTASLGQLDKMIKAFGEYPTVNIEIYKANREKIDGFINTIQALEGSDHSQAGEKKAPSQEEPPADQDK